MNIRKFVNDIFTYIMKQFALFDLKELIQIFALSITISALLVSISTFNTPGKIHVDLSAMKPSEPSIIYTRDLLEYYRNNKLLIPPVLNNTTFKNQVYDQFVTVIDNVPKYASSKPDHFRFAFYPLIQNPKLLEEFITNQKYFTPFFNAISEGGDIIDQSIGNLNFYKSSLTKKQYFIFLYALLKQRTFEQELIIANDGKLDLKDVRILIYAPYTHGFKSEIVRILPWGKPKRYFETFYSDHVEISLIDLNINEDISFRVSTKGNPILETDILIDYKKINVIDYTLLIKYLAIMLIAIFSVSICVKNTIIYYGQK